MNEMIKKPSPIEDIILLGDALQNLQSLQDETINCIVTSPPYYGLRDYGNDNQIGLEDTPEAYIDKLVGIFSECKRVLKNEGTLWLNLGDSYFNNNKSVINNNGSSTSTLRGKGKGTKLEAIRLASAANAQRASIYGTSDKAPVNYQANGCLCGNLIDKACEYCVEKESYSPPYIQPYCTTQNYKPKDLMLMPFRVAMALQADGWYLRSDIIWHKPNCMPESVKDRPTNDYEHVFLLSKSRNYFYDADNIREPHISSEGVPRTRGQETYAGARLNKGSNVLTTGYHLNGRNKRAVWSISTKAFGEAHFAVMPLELADICIKAGCPKDGIVLDPFGGAGTTAIAALQNFCHYLLIELNPDYIELAQKRIKQQSLEGVQVPLFS